MHTRLDSKMPATLDTPSVAEVERAHAIPLVSQVQKLEMAHDYFEHACSDDMTRFLATENLGEPGETTRLFELMLSEKMSPNLSISIASDSSKSQIWWSDLAHLIEALPPAHEKNVGHVDQHMRETLMLLAQEAPQRKIIV